MYAHGHLNCPLAPVQRTKPKKNHTIPGIIYNLKDFKINSYKVDSRMEDSWDLNGRQTDS